MRLYSFDGYLLSESDRRLTDPSGEEVLLTPRVFDLLLKLVSSAGTVVTKDELLATVWADAIVEESNLSQSVFVLRRALGDPTQSPRLIRTIPKQGYKFIGDVTQVESEDVREIRAEPAESPSAKENAVVAKRPSRPRAWPIAVGAVAAALLLAAVYFGISRRSSAPDVTYQQLTFERGTVWSARFLPDSNAVFYTANFNNNGLALFAYHLNAPGSRDIGLRNANLLAISPKGEMAILRNPSYIYQFIQRGTLATLSVDGNAPRDIAENVQEADFSPDGAELAIVRWNENGNLLEYPIGRELAATKGYFSCPTISPRGDQIAYFSHQFQKDNRGTVNVIDKDGRSLLVSEEFAGLEGLAWHGDEVWFTASRSGEQYSLFALEKNGRVRSVAVAPSNLILQDIGSDGTALVSRATQYTDVYVNDGGPRDTDMSWLQLIGPADICPDGKAFIFTHFGPESGNNYSVYLRKTDRSPAVRLGDGRGLALSPDSKWVVAKISEPEQLELLPTGIGESRILPTANLEHFGAASWSSDGRQIVFVANEKGHAVRSFSFDLGDDSIRPISPAGFRGTLLSPDGKTLIVAGPEGEKGLLEIATGRISAVKGLASGEDVVRWASDGRSIFVFRPYELPIRITKLDTLTGRREFVREISPSDPSGVFGNIYLFLTPDGKVALYGLRRYMIDLFLAKGLS